MTTGAFVLCARWLVKLTPGIVTPFFLNFPSIYKSTCVNSTPYSLSCVPFDEQNKEVIMDYEGQDHFLDSRGDKKQPSVTRPVQVNPGVHPAEQFFSLAHFVT
jgi:hypothetical protein